ncbi:hypothetical protein BVRB_016390, partial [Beta vulgaris subsp. vulgaris]
MDSQVIQPQILEAQSAIYWKKDLNVERVPTSFNRIHDRILTQCIAIANTILLIHPYIPPDINTQGRNAYWNDIHAFIEQWNEKHPTHTVIITGDLNTRDIRFGANHTENHKYLDQILLSMEIISDGNTPTRENNNLDVTLVKQGIGIGSITNTVLHKLNSDHDPTQTEVEIGHSPYISDAACMRQNPTLTEYTVMDYSKIKKNISDALKEFQSSEISLNDVNKILKQCTAYKTIKHKPIKFWTPQLKKAVRLQNKARKAISKARKRNEDLTAPYHEYKLTQKEFRKLFKAAKKAFNIRQIKQACQDPTGAEFYRIIKQLERRLNKRATHPTEYMNQAEDECEQIAAKFEDIFGQEDVKPSPDETTLLQSDLQNVKLRFTTESKPPFTKRELDQAIKKANLKSAKGPDGISNRLIKTAMEVDSFTELMLAAINNQIIHLGEYPKELKIARIIPLPKAKPGEFRPISLLSSLSKLIEYMIQIRIREEIERDLPRLQFGCRPGHSTAQALMRLMHYSGTAAGKRKQFGAVLYDFTKAYDRVPKHILLRKMQELEIPVYLINIVTWDQQGCTADGWTPFGPVRRAVEVTAKRYNARIHPQIIVKSHILEQLTSCIFHMSSREEALEKHKNGQLIPTNPDIALWTDGSFNPEKSKADAFISSGAASILLISDPDPHSTIFELEIHSAVEIEHVTSSYEAEIIALQTGVSTLLELYPENRHIHIFTDSLSCLQQLACLPYKYKFVNAVVKDVAEKLAELSEDNAVELHFIPSHTHLIEESDAIDELAKQAATNGELIEHDPLVSSYRLTFKELEKQKLHNYLVKNVKPSAFTNYPRRTPLIDGYSRT